MSDKIAGYLEVGIDPVTFEVVVNHPKMDVDADGVGHLVFSERQARNLGNLLIRQAFEAETARLNAMPPAIHAFRHGLVLCGFTRRLPRRWPDGHRWTDPEDTANITCPGCLQVAQAAP